MVFIRLLRRRIKIIIACISVILALDLGLSVLGAAATMHSRDFLSTDSLRFCWSDFPKCSILQPVSMQLTSKGGFCRFRITRRV